MMRRWSFFSTKNSLASVATEKDVNNLYFKYVAVCVFVSSTALFLNFQDCDWCDEELAGVINHARTRIL